MANRLRTIEQTMAIDIIEKSDNYFLLSKSYDKPIHIGNRKKLSSVLFDIHPDMIIATYGTSKNCIVIMDYQLGELMDIISAKKAQS